MSRIFFLLICSLVFEGCSSALPVTQASGVPEDVVAQRHKVEESARIAEEYAQQAAALVAENKLLLQEVEKLVARAAKAEKQCKASLRRIPRRPRVVKKKPVEKMKDTEKQQEQKKMDDMPKYSPSDAPL